MENLAKTGGIELSRDQLNLFFSVDDSEKLSRIEDSEKLSRIEDSENPSSSSINSVGHDKWLSFLEGNESNSSVLASMGNSDRSGLFSVQEDSEGELDNSFNSAKLLVMGCGTNAPLSLMALDEEDENELSDDLDYDHVVGHRSLTALDEEPGSSNFCAGSLTGLDEDLGSSNLCAGSLTGLDEEPGSSSFCAGSLTGLDEDPGSSNFCAGSLTGLDEEDELEEKYDPNNPPFMGSASCLALEEGEDVEPDNVSEPGHGALRASSLLRDEEGESEFNSDQGLGNGSGSSNYMSVNEVKEGQFVGESVEPDDTVSDGRAHGNLHAAVKEGKESEADGSTTCRSDEHMIHNDSSITEGEGKLMGNQSTVTFMDT
jgi:hypothetical protein